MSLFKNTFEYGKDWETESSGEKSKAKGFAARQHEHLSQGVSHSNSPIRPSHIKTILRVVVWLAILGLVFNGTIRSWIYNNIDIEASTQIEEETADETDDLKNKIQSDIQAEVDEKLKEAGLKE